LGSLALEIGRALRRIRKERGLTLREVAVTSGGAFKATSVAGYERGERSITLERFILLCHLYDADAGEVLGEIRRSAGDALDAEGFATDPAFERLGPRERELLRALVRQVRERRGSSPPSRVMVRIEDLTVLATAAGADPDELLDALRGRRGGSEEASPASDR
jgi:transcriptional regulator with XRE-family HTH domain